MKEGSLYLINVFVGAEARGNPCCVLFLQDLSDEHKLQQIAKDINAPATCFCQEQEDGLFVKWFAPEGKIDLCGHGALGMAWLMLRLLGYGETLQISYEGGSLTAGMVGDRVSIKGNSIPANTAEVPDWLIEGFGPSVIGYYPSANKHIVLLRDESDVRSMQPNWDPLRRSGVFSFAVTAKGSAYDFVSRVFLPKLKVLEDAATGSAHMTLAPFWSDRLGKASLHAFQASERGGDIHCTTSGSRVEISAKCDCFARGELSSDNEIRSN